MKKNTALLTLKSSKKNTMTNSNQASKKKNIYIYTEADLGEGILDEGVNPSYYTTSIDNIEATNQDYKVVTSLVEIKNYGLKIVNVEEDFNYAYYL